MSRLGLPHRIPPGKKTLKKQFTVWGIFWQITGSEAHAKPPVTAACFVIPAANLNLRSCRMGRTFVFILIFLFLDGIDQFDGKAAVFRAEFIGCINKEPHFR